MGRKEAGEPVCGGRHLTEGPHANGYFVEPTVFANVTPDMVIAREEIFGPVLAILRARDFDRALEIANGSEFGLSASIQTRNSRACTSFIYGRYRGRAGHRQSAQRRRRIPTPLRRLQGFQFRSQGTGAGRDGIL